MLYLPALLPDTLESCRDAHDEDQLFDMLISHHPSLILFFEFACDDETWTEMYPDLMKRILQWLTEEFLQDRLLFSYAHRIANKIREHHAKILQHLPKNICCKVNQFEIRANSLLLQESSDILYDLILHLADKLPDEKLKIDELDEKEFLFVLEFLTTGSITNLWRESQLEILRLLNQVREWRMHEVSLFIQGVYKRYVDRINAIQVLIDSHEKGWLVLRKRAFEIIEDQNLGITFPDKDDQSLTVEFMHFREEGLSIFHKISHLVTCLICRSSLPENASFGDVLQACTNLIALDLGGSSNLSPYLNLASSSLEELDISLCPWLNETSIQKIVQDCPQIQKLRLKSNTHIRYSFWSEISKFSNLRGLDLSRCHQINDETFKIIVRGCPRLEELSLENCEQLGNVSYYTMAKELKQLRYFNVSRCYITDAALIEIVTGCHYLTTLLIDKCLSLSARGIREAIRQGPQLRKVSIRQNNLEPTFLEQLQNQFPLLELVQNLSNPVNKLW